MSARVEEERRPVCVVCGQRCIQDRPAGSFYCPGGGWPHTPAPRGRMSGELFHGPGASGTVGA